ncbi:hypothetical protein F5X71_29225 [Nocardia brasiliensis]|uniref:Streptomyces killer toxin-like beta/gamma crystallin domain-containing protein n=1 Tax=Nocardia brasiliensis TaxID=37326 RepID=A0A6G9XY51_NOCBR|nr:hypothetical protein [Nocardia brasiliensis]QIS05844.1 hypothetical protein F5X71_29225 [Nocardia brasiliensis]
MGKLFPRVLAATVFAGCAVGFAPTAAAAPSIYEPSITPCGHLFTTPLELPRPGTNRYWSPFGTADIVCYDAGSLGVSYYQRDPGGLWHAMNQLIPGNYFINVFGYDHLPA